MTDEARFSSDPPPLAGYRIRLAARRVRRGAGRARGGSTRLVLREVLPTFAVPSPVVYSPFVPTKVSLNDALLCRWRCGGRLLKRALWQFDGNGCHRVFAPIEESRC